MLNQTVLVGRVTKTPETIENQDGSKSTTLDLAIPRTFKNENGEYDVDYISCTLNKMIADNVCNYIKKGDTVGIRVRIQNLNNTTQLQLIAEKVSFLSSKEE